MRFINHLSLLLLVATATSCVPDVEHEIILVEDSWIMVNIESKISVEELKEFCPLLL